MANNHAIADWVIFMVDDELDNLGVATKVLKYYGATVYTASNGIEGLEKLGELMKHTTPTLVLLDLSMPEMSGWDMVKAMRADARFKDLIVSALTAHAMDGDRDAVLASGFDWYITKPFHIGTLMSQITACVAQVKHQRAQASVMQANAVQTNPVELNAVQSNAVEPNAVQANPMQPNAAQTNVVQTNTSAE